jgi:hypothetical protein
MICSRLAHVPCMQVTVLNQSDGQPMIQIQAVLPVVQKMLPPAVGTVTRPCSLHPSYQWWCAL